MGRGGSRRVGGKVRNLGEVGDCCLECTRPDHRRKSKQTSSLTPSLQYILPDRHQSYVTVLYLKLSIETVFPKQER